VVFLAGEVFFTAPFALLVVLGVVRFVAEVFAVLGADLAALFLPPLDLAAVAGADVPVAPALAVLGLAAPFVARLVLPPPAPGVRALVALVLAGPAPAAALAVRALAVTVFTGLVFVFPPPLDAALLALVLASRPSWSLLPRCSFATTPGRAAFVESVHGPGGHTVPRSGSAG
jgi:hypothetical protein